MTFKMKWQHLVLGLATTFYLGVVSIFALQFWLLGLIVGLMFFPVYLATLFSLRATMGKKSNLRGYRRIYIHHKAGQHYNNISFRPKWDDWPEKYMPFLQPNFIRRLPKGWLPTEERWQFSLRLKRKLEKLSFDPAGYVIVEQKDADTRKAISYADLIQPDDSLLLSPQLFEFRRKHNFPEEMYKAAKRSLRSPLGSLPMILLIVGIMVVAFMVLKMLGVI